MAFALLPPDFRYCTSNFTGTPTLTPATSVTAGASNADGTAVSIFAAIAHDVEYLIVGSENFQSVTTNTNALADILIDPAGGSSWTPLINDLIVGNARLLTTNARPFVPRLYHFPIWIKSGSSIGVRIRNARAATTTGRIYMTVYGGNRNAGSWWCGQAVETIGVNAATSSGTSHTAGNTGSYSSWTNFGSTLAFQCRALQWGVGGGGLTAMNALTYFFEFGVGSQRIGPPLAVSGDTGESDVQSPLVAPMFKTLAAGTQLQVRGTCSGTAQARDVAAYCIR